MGYIIIDTETADTQTHSDGNAHPETSLVYDCGWVVCANSCEELVRRSFVVNETFANAKLMSSAYYADKLPQYYKGMRDGTWNPVSFVDIWKKFKSDCKEFGVKRVAAYNARFDRTALNYTIETYSNGFVKWFTPYGVEWFDVWDYASCITGTQKYVRWCIDNGYVSPKGNPKTNAEIVYRYLTNDPCFVEAHTALDDATRELFIYQRAKRLHRKTRHTIGQGWRDAANICKNL